MRCKIDDDQDNEADDESRRPGRASSCTRSIPTAKRMGSENCGCVVKPRSENCPATWDPAKPLSVWRCTRGDPWLTRWPLILVLMGWLRASQATGHVTIALEWFFGPRKNFKFFLQIWSNWGHTAVKSNALAELMNRASKIHWKNLSLTLNGRNSETRKCGSTSIPEKSYKNVAQQW